MMPAVLKTWTGADLIFVPSVHEYRLPLDGRIVPSVTHVLRETGVSVDFEEVASISATVADAVAYKRALGTAVHADAWAMDDNDLDWDTVNPDVLPYLHAWAEFRENQQLLPLQRERKVYSPTLGICGTLDGVFYRGDDPGRRVLVDLKLGDPEAAGARYQTALYQILWDEEHPDQLIAERWSVRLTPEHREPYRIQPYSEWTDVAKARAIVTTYFCQYARRHR